MGEKKRKLQNVPPPHIRPYRVAICIPSQSMVHADMAMSLTGLCAHSAQGVALAVLNEKNSMITDARNKLVKRALEFGSDWLLFVDSDMVFPMDALMGLLRHDKDIVGATYNKRVHPFETLGRFVGPGRDISAGGLIEAELLPGGFMLVRAAVFRAMMDPNRQQQIWFREHYDEAEPNRCISEDYAFCMAARAKGFRIWCDLDLTNKIGHIGEQVVTCRIDMPAEQAKAA